MKLLITGAYGQLGNEIKVLSENYGEWEFIFTDIDLLDITDKNAVTDFLNLTKRQGLKVSCIEEIAYKMGFIGKEKLIELAQPLSENQYGQYLLKLADNQIISF